ncbi:hypothetical protein V3C99_000002 [Haemonchus contortus]|uniref:ATP-dependent DNA helicase n=2 Tax=Haemonchus contortus TaxID=6289 RepID=A0A7I5EE28_HAECO
MTSLFFPAVAISEKQGGSFYIYSPLLRVCGGDHLDILAQYFVPGNIQESVSQRRRGRPRIHPSDVERQRRRRQVESSQERDARLRRDVSRRRQRRGRETDQERSERSQQLSQSQQRTREQESREERAARRREDAERHRQMRARESSEERAARRREDVERHLHRRARESSEERSARERYDAERLRRMRERESRDERAARRREDAERHRQMRARESSEERAAREREDAERHRQMRARESSEERAAREREDAERHRQMRARESSEERAAREREDAERHRQMRARESSEERTAREREDAERHRQMRARESSEERAAREREDAERHWQMRARESSEERAVREREDAERHRQMRARESSEERRIRLASDADRHRMSRNPPSRVLGVATRNRLAECSYLGGLDNICEHCGAQHFLCEVKPQHPELFFECCDLGRFNLNFFGEFPDRLRRLYVRDPTNTDEEQRIQRNFFENIRSFNSALAMASMGAQIDTIRGRGPYCYRIHGQIYHRIGPLHPREGEQRQYGQIYILDTEMAAGHRLGDPRNVDCDPELMRSLSELLSEVNVYAQSFKMMAEIEQAEIAAAIREHRAPLNIRMIFEKSSESGLRRRQYDLPTANEVAVIYVGENDDVPPTRSLAVHLRNASGEQLQSIRDIDKICDPLTYPLLFPTGDGGWEPSMTKENGFRLSQREYYAYLSSVRDQFNPILYAGKLFQQFAVDAYVKIEQNRLNFTRRNQLRLRSDSYRGLQDYLAGDDFSGPPGARVILPSSFFGGPRSMMQSYQDAMAIVARHGKPTYFLTMTCNPQWKEIQENLFSGQTASDRPDLVSRVFNAKVQELCFDLFKKHVLGEVQAYVYVIEFQKRGLPHCHMLLIMKEEWRVRTADDVDRSICAEIPNPAEEPVLHAAVMSYMIHRRCGQRDSPCTLPNGSCSRRFPKQIREHTSVDVDGYPNYRRRNLHPSEINNVLYGDQWVVPSNPYLLTKFDCHVNLEVCGMISAVKYLYKYVYKGPDRARINIESSRNGDETTNVDEIKQHLDTRYVCAPESMYRIFSFEMQDKSHSIVRLAVHLPGFQTVLFVEGREQQYLDNARTSFTTLTAYFELNRQYVQMGDNVHYAIDPRELYYYQLPEYFTFKPRRGWKARERSGKYIGRMYTVSPRDTERYCLRILLLNTKGKLSFEDLRTVDGVTYDSFAEAARCAGFLDDDRYFRQSLQEAAHYQSAACLRSFFACLLCFAEVVHAQDLWNEFAQAMSDDFFYQGIERELAIAHAYFDVLDRMAVLGRDLRETVTPPMAERPVAPPMTVDYEEHERNGMLQYETLNTEQKAAADDIIDALDRPRNRCIFIDGPGGSGKTYLYNTVYNIAVGRRLQVACVAWTGIAANLLPGGRTVNSVFKLNIADGNRTSTMKRQQKEARELFSTDIIIWDEISMTPKVALEAVDTLLKDIMQNSEPFGGKIMIIGGDFRQVLPVVEHGGRQDSVEACVHKSALWSLFTIHHLSVNMRARDAGSDWHERLIEIGNGDCNDADECVQMPEEMMCSSDIVTEVFGATLDPDRTSELYECAILAPKNVHVQRLNDTALDRLRVDRSEDEKTYKSVDEAIYLEGQYNQLFQQEYLNSLTPTGMPPHELRLKRGTIVMLLRNLDVTNGLCNGTRLRIETLGRFTLACKFICGDRAGRLAIIPRIDNYWEKRVPFRLRRRQFPVRVAFAMTINKAQGQSFNKVGVYLPQDVFSHGQLYVALSRARTPSGIRINSSKDAIKNIVFPEALL